MTDICKLISRGRVKMLIELRDGKHTVIPQNVECDNNGDIGIRVTSFFGHANSAQIRQLSYEDKTDRTIDSVLWKESDWYQRPVEERLKYFPKIEIGDNVEYGNY